MKLPLSAITLQNMAEIQLQTRFFRYLESLVSGLAAKFLLPHLETSLQNPVASVVLTRERLNKREPEDNDDIPENHISDQQESLEVKVAAPILARLHFQTINVAWELSDPGLRSCRIRRETQTWNYSQTQ